MTHYVQVYDIIHETSSRPIPSVFCTVVRGRPSYNHG